MSHRDSRSVTPSDKQGAYLGAVRRSTDNALTTFLIEPYHKIRIIIRLPDGHEAVILNLKYGKVSSVRVAGMWTLLPVQSLPAQRAIIRKVCSAHRRVASPRTTRLELLSPASRETD